MEQWLRLKYSRGGRRHDVFPGRGKFLSQSEHEGRLASPTYQADYFAFTNIKRFYEFHFPEFLSREGLKI